MLDLATPLSRDFGGDARLGEILSVLSPFEARHLTVDYGGRRVRPGYHVTEVKAGTFVTLDCGGNPDRWSETILQIEDLPLEAGKQPMTVGKFRSILGKVGAMIDLVADARLTIEIGPPGHPMQVFDVQSVGIDGESIVLDLMSRSAICKPRHRATQIADKPCCGGSPSSCC